jgi:hypothetical protein
MFKASFHLVIGRTLLKELIMKRAQRVPAEKPSILGLDQYTFKSKHN